MVGNDPNTVVPVWTLATSDVSVPAIAGIEQMTPQRLNDLRAALAALADTPIVTLEAHPMPENIDRTRGISLGRDSQLAQHLSRLITETIRSEPTSPVAAGVDALYRMVVPAKAAAQLSGGLVKPMASKDAPGGVHSALVNSSAGIAGHATFLPVGTAATALTPAASLVLLAVAAGVLIVDHVDQRFNEIHESVEALRQDLLEAELVRLDACRTAIALATAALLDGGHIGPEIGLEPAVNGVQEAFTAANRRLTQWQQALAKLPEGKVELPILRKAFAHIGEPTSGRFRAHLDLARLAIDLKRRVLLMQAVGAAQMDQGNPFDRFMGVLQAEERRLHDLASGIDAVLFRLSVLQLDRTHGVRDVVFTAGEVDGLLRTSRQLRELGEYVDTAKPQADIAIEMARSADGSVFVLPALEA